MFASPLFLFVFTLLFFARGIFASGGVTINEIAWMGTLPKEGESARAAANNEWIELHSSSATETNLDGWKIVSEDGTPDLELAGTIGAGGYFLLERASDDVIPSIAADLVYPYKNALSNSGERLFLKNNLGQVVDEVDAKNDWPAGDKSTKLTMQRSENSWVTATATPKAVNVSQTVTIVSPPPSSTSGPVTNSYSLFNVPEIVAEGGDDRTVIVGSVVEFLGSALLKDGTELENARFWWNFGDGEAKEGRAIAHTFSIPGKYTAGLHVSSGSSAASDYIYINVVPNQIIISEVLNGESGFVKLYNPTKSLLDIGGWIIEDSQGKRFTVPLRTKINGESEIAFSNKTTGLLMGAAGSQVTIRYQNGVVALEKDAKVVMPSTPKNTASQIVTAQTKAASGVQPAALYQVKSEEPRREDSKFDDAASSSNSRSEEFADIPGPKDFSGFFFWIAVTLSLVSAIVFFVLRGRLS